MNRYATAALFLAVTCSTALPACAQSGSYLTFTSTEHDRATVALGDPDDTNALTLEAWVRYDADTFLGEFNTILEYGDREPFLGVSVSDDGAPTLYLLGTVSGGTVPVGQWVHVAYTWDGTTSRLYLDGAEVASEQGNPQNSGASVLGIGASPERDDLTTGWEGAIDEVVVWYEARTAAQVQADRQGLSAADLTDPDLVAYFRFEEEEGQTIQNEKAGGVDGVLGTTLSTEATDPARVIATPSEPGAEPTGAALRLHDVYPNPARDRASLTVEIDETQPVEVALFNALGQRMAVLHSGVLAARQPHTFVLDATGLPAGVYLVRAKGAARRATRTVTLVN